MVCQLKGYFPGRFGSYYLFREGTVRGGHAVPLIRDNTVRKRWVRRELRLHRDRAGCVQNSIFFGRREEKISWGKGIEW